MVFKNSSSYFLTNTYPSMEKYELFSPSNIVRVITSHGSSVKDVETLLKKILWNPTIVTSLLGLIMKATTVYLELASKDKYGIRTEPYSSIKLKLLVTPLMIAAVIPRISACAVFFGSCFPLFNYKNEMDNLILRVRFGLFIFLCCSFIYIVASVVYGCFRVRVSTVVEMSINQLTGCTYVSTHSFFPI